MNRFSIKTHRPGRKYDRPHFFILNKGMNSGKPLTAPCPNCFALTTDCKASKDQLYWLTFGLWQIGAFHSFIRGSVIPFITLKEYSNCLQTAFKKASNDKQAFQKHVQTLKLLNRKESELTRSMDLIQETRQAIFKSYTNSLRLR